MFFDKVYKSVSSDNVASIERTAKELEKTNKSIGRFGDGEISWMFNVRGDNKKSFERSSPLLSERLKEVFSSNNDDFMIGVPDYITNIGNDQYVFNIDLFWKIYIIRRRKYLKKIINKHQNYWNTAVTRPYIDFNNRDIADKTFSTLKKVWRSKKILIVEGNESRLGADDDLFDNVKEIRRIECPYKNAFDSYNDILKTTIDFLNINRDFLVLISLGPTATVLSYDLFMNGYRAIDIGHIDVEYEWYLMGAKEKVDLKYKYVNEVSGGHGALTLSNSTFDKEVVAIVK
ncbi:GT-D fold domain-containing glycosyltransferase [Apilactobacillus timberlakei]|nr:GT-D fold domain-containing glycosyltransferase [Apilactobacillus timberlakei]